MSTNSFASRLRSILAPCAKCGDAYVEVPNLEPLYRAVALSFARQRRPLGSQQIKWLRKHVGFSGQDLPHA